MSNEITGGNKMEDALTKIADADRAILIEAFDQQLNEAGSRRR
jgi:hypothetical protein